MSVRGNETLESGLMLGSLGPDGAGINELFQSAARGDSSLVAKPEDVALPFPFGLLLISSRAAARRVRFLGAFECTTV